MLIYLQLNKLTVNICNMGKENRNPGNIKKKNIKLADVDVSSLIGEYVFFNFWWFT